MACDSPIYIHVKFRGEIPFPCGKCPPCRKRKVDQWVFRLLEEDKVSEMSHFITLTYDTEHVPISQNGFMTLDKSDLQKFWKRLRKNTGYEKIKYFACGEYGEARYRPHYHAIVFNVPTVVSYAQAWSLDGQAIGSVDVGNVSGNSIAYVAKYMDKDGRIPAHGRDDRVPEFITMSKGLGSAYLDSMEILQYHRSRLDQLFLTRKGGYRIAMPKYYRERIWDEHERSLQIPIIREAVKRAQELKDKKLINRGIDPHKFNESEKIGRYERFHNTKKHKKRNQD